MWCESCREAKEWREKEADAVKGEVERNEKGETFCPPCRTGRKTPWWNWGGEVERTVSRAQKEGAGITDPRRVAETVNQKAVQKEEAREVR